jgi:hypothetical protein
VNVKYPGPSSGGWGGAAIALCGVDPFCIANGGVSPFDMPEAQVKCIDGYCMVGSANFAQYNIGGTYTVNWDAQMQAEINADENKIYKTFLVLAQNIGLAPDQSIKIGYKWAAGVWNVWCPQGTSCEVNQARASENGWKDPLTAFHSESWYQGPWYDSVGFDVGHFAVGLDGVIGAHIDTFGPFNPFHYLIQMPEMLIPQSPTGYATCAISGGCSF